MINESNRAVEDNVNQAINNASEALNKSIDKIWSLIGLEEGVLFVPIPIESVSKYDFEFFAPHPGKYMWIASGSKVK